MGLTELRSGNPLDNPAIPLNSPAVWNWFTGGEPTASGETVNETNALTLTTVYSCVTTIASNVASLPLKLMERTPGGHQEAIDNNLYYLLSVEPNPEMSKDTFIETLVGCLALTGNCYAQIQRNGLGQPIALYPLHPLLTEPFRQSDKTLAYKTTDGMANGQSRIINAADIIHVPLFSFDGLKGISPIAMARQSLGLAKAAEKFGARLFGNGARPGGILLNKGPKPTPQVMKEMRESWQEQAGGVNQGKIQFLFGGDWSYESLGLNAEESQFLATRNYQRADIAALFHLSPHMVGDTSRLSGTNSEQMMLQFVTMTLRPYLSKIEGELIRKLCPTVGCKAGKFFIQFDVNALLKVDFKTSMEGYSAGRNGGWYSANDVLRKLGENPGGKALDQYIVPVNYVNAETMLKAVNEPAPTETKPEPPPTEAERNLLGVYTRSYMSLYTDAFKRLQTRSKRDYSTINALFRPVLRCIADNCIADRDSTVAGNADQLADTVVEDALKAMTKRASKWSDENVNAHQATEFLKAVRSIHISVSRELAATKAASELTVTEEEEVHEEGN
jgi:HK97 family phage portal protein